MRRSNEPNRADDVARARHDKPVMIALPIPADVPVLDGQAALFESPDSLLTLEVADLRTLAVSVGRHGGNVLAQVRRAAGLVAWAGWHRFNAKDYEEFVAGLAGDLGVEIQTVRRWRSVVVSAGHLAVPALAAERATAAKNRPQKRRSEAVRDTAVSPDSTIPATSRETPQPSEEHPWAAVPPIEPPVAQPVDAPEAVSPAEPDALPCPFCGLSADDGPLTINQEIAQVFSLLRNLDPPEFFTAMSDAQRDELREFIGRMNPAKRSPGHVITPEDRRRADEMVVDPATCEHPRAKRKSLGYATLCGACNTKIA